MTDDKLREACERVAKAWLGWEIRRWQDGDFDAGDHYMEIVNGEWFAVSNPYEGPSAFVTPDNMHPLLASPWGMDLLLDAVGKRSGLFAEYTQSIQLFELNQPHKWRIYNLKIQPWRRFVNRIGSGESENRYAALIFALDKAGEVFDEAV